MILILLRPLKVYIYNNTTLPGLLTKTVQPQKSDSSASSKSCSAGSGSSGSSDSSTDSESSESIASPQPQIKKKDTQPSATVAAATNVPPKRPSVAVAPVKPQKCTKRQSRFYDFSSIYIYNSGNFCFYI